MTENKNMEDIRHSFLNILDHLPCDVIRTLWTIQSLELENKSPAESLRQANHLLLMIQREKQLLEFQTSELEHLMETMKHFKNNRNKPVKVKKTRHKKPLKIKLKLSMGSSLTRHHIKEEKYCMCRNISYGPMIACDNEKCPIEWFHYGCIGLTKAPKNEVKWFCGQECEKQHNERCR